MREWRKSRKILILGAGISQIGGISSVPLRRRYRTIRRCRGGFPDIGSVQNEGSPSFQAPRHSDKAGRMRLESGDQDGAGDRERGDPDEIEIDPPTAKD